MVKENQMADNTAELEDDPIKAAAQEAEAPAPEKEPPAEEAPKGGNEEVSPDVGLEALKIQLRNEQAARIEAERRADMAQHQARRSEVEVQDSNLQIVVSAIEAVKRENAMAKHKLAEAMRSQDFDAAAEMQEIISINASKLTQLENGRVALEARVEAAKRRPREQQPQQGEQPRRDAPQDPVEHFASQLSPKSAAWIRSHPECVLDGKKNLKMLGIHNIAIADGLAPDSDEYFDFIETQLGYKRPQAVPRAEEDGDGDDPTSQAAKPVQRRPPPPAAPPSRGSSNGNRMTLTAAQREAAQISGLTEEEYAKNLQSDRKRRSN